MPGAKTVAAGRKAFFFHVLCATCLAHPACICGRAGLYEFFPALREAPWLAPWWQFATFTLNLLVDYGPDQAFSHAWSLCVEGHFYLLFPLLAWWLVRRPSTRKFGAVCVGVVALGIALRSGTWLHDVAIKSSRNWFVEDIYTRPGRGSTDC